MTQDEELTHFRLSPLLVQCAQSMFLALGRGGFVVTESYKAPDSDPDELDELMMNGLGMRLGAPEDDDEAPPPVDIAAVAIKRCEEMFKGEDEDGTNMVLVLEEESVFVGVNASDFSATFVDGAVDADGIAWTNVAFERWLNEQRFGFGADVATIGVPMCLDAEDLPPGGTFPEDKEAAEACGRVYEPLLADSDFAEDLYLILPQDNVVFADEENEMMRYPPPPPLSAPREGMVLVVGLAGGVWFFAFGCLLMSSQQQGHAAAGEQVLDVCTLDCARLARRGDQCDQGLGHNRG